MKKTTLASTIGMAALATTLFTGDVQADTATNVSANVPAIAMQAPARGALTSKFGQFVAETALLGTYGALGILALSLKKDADPAPQIS